MKMKTNFVENGSSNNNQNNVGTSSPSNQSSSLVNQQQYSDLSGKPLSLVGTQHSQSNHQINGVGGVGNQANYQTLDSQGNVIMENNLSVSSEPPYDSRFERGHNLDKPFHSQSQSYIQAANQIVENGHFSHFQNTNTQSNTNRSSQ